MQKKKIGFIGAGNMASSLISGLLKSQTLAPSDIVFFQPNTERAKRTQSRFNIELADSNKSLVRQAETVVLATKPQMLPEMLPPLASTFKDTQPFIVSVAAGVRTSSIEKLLGGEHAVARAMPNTPAQVGMAATGLFANNRVTTEQKETTQQLFSTIGEAAWVNSESDIDSITALSGSGPAYFMRFMLSLIDAAENAGLDRELAHNFAVQTAIGSAKMVQQSDVSLAELIDNVTSPNGTTAAALAEFDNADLSDIVGQAFNAAKRRSEELEKELS